jgi:hypothetical protein
MSMAEIIRLKRGGGKTLTLLKMADENGGIIVGQRTDKLRQMAHELGYKNIKGFYSIPEYIEHCCGRPQSPFDDKINQFYIDNFENVANYLDNVKAITVSID